MLFSLEFRIMLSLLQFANLLFISGALLVLETIAT